MARRVAQPSSLNSIRALGGFCKGWVFAIADSGLVGNIRAPRCNTALLFSFVAAGLSRHLCLFLSRKAITPRPSPADLVFLSVNGSPGSGLLDTPAGQV
jgi:hypothetical protein